MMYVLKYFMDISWYFTAQLKIRKCMKSSFFSFSFVFPSGRLSVTLDIQIKYDTQLTIGSQFGSIIRTLSNIQNGGFHVNS